MPDRTTVILYHVPKTGGVAVRNSLRENLPDGYVVHLGGDSRTTDPDAIRANFAEGDERHEARVVCGHLVTRDMRTLLTGNVVEATVIRDPGEWAYSEYSYRKYALNDDRWASFEDYVKNRSPNGQASFVASAIWGDLGSRPQKRLEGLAEEVERSFDVVGPSTHLNEIASQIVAAVFRPVELEVGRHNVTAELADKEALDGERSDSVRIRELSEEYRTHSEVDQALFELALGNMATSNLLEGK